MPTYTVVVAIGQSSLDLAEWEEFISKTDKALDTQGSIISAAEGWGEYEGTDEWTFQWIITDVTDLAGLQDAVCAIAKDYRQEAVGIIATTGNTIFPTGYVQEDNNA